MVRQITITVPHEKVSGIRDVLHKQSIVHHLEVYNGETASMIICKVVNKKTDEILQLLARYSVGIRYGHIDVVALTSTRPRIATFRGVKPKSHKFMVTDRMSYDEMVDFIDSQIHLTFDYLALIAVGAMICAGGLLTNSAVNVVASMLVSPLMGPIVGMTFSTIVRDRRMFWVSLRNEFLGLFVCWICGVSFGFLVGTFFDSQSQDGPMGHNTEMSSRGTLTGLAWGAAVAVPSGLGVALGVSSYTISALIGVAISAALLPPIVNSGVCLGASFIMFFIPSQPDHVIINHWVKTGVISLMLFLLNWVILYLSALVMFRIKRLNYHANDQSKSEKLAQFSKLVDDPSYTVLPDSTTRGRGTTQPGIDSSAASIFSNGKAGGISSSDVAFETNIQSSKSLLRGSSARRVPSLNYPLLQDAEINTVPMSLPRKGSNSSKSSNNVQITRRHSHNSSGVLKTGSTKAAMAKQYDFPILDDNDGPNVVRKKSSSTSNVFEAGLNGGQSVNNFSSGRLTQSAETVAVQSREDELRIANNPLKLRKGSK